MGIGESLVTAINPYTDLEYATCQQEAYFPEDQVSITTPATSNYQTASTDPLSRAFPVASLAAQGVLSLLGCTEEKAPEAVVPDKVIGSEFPRGTAIMTMSGQPQTMVYMRTTTAEEREPSRLINLPLIETSLETGRVQFKPGIAHSLERSKDGKVIRLTLRDDIQWSDGTPLTARDILFTIDLMKSNLVITSMKFNTAIDKERFPIVSEDNPNVIEFHYKVPYNESQQLLELEWIVPLPAHAMKVERQEGSTLRELRLAELPELRERLEKTQDAAERAQLQAEIGAIENALSFLKGNPYNRHPEVVSGRFRIEAWDGGKLVLEANENYTGPDPAKLQRIIFKILPEPTTRDVEFENCTVDIHRGISSESLEIMTDSRSCPFTSYHISWDTIDILAWNSIDRADMKRHRDDLKDGQTINDIDYSTVKPNALFADPWIRLALTMAIDRQDIIHDLVGDDYGMEAVSTISPNLSGGAKSGHHADPLPS